MIPRIKLIVEHRVSAPDAYGNRYWVSVLTSTLTGDSVSFTTPHRSNTEHLIVPVLDWEDVHAYVTEWSKRDFKRMERGVENSNVCNDAWVTGWVSEHCYAGDV